MQSSKAQRPQAPNTARKIPPSANAGGGSHSAHRFTSFTPLSPEESKGIFNFSKLLPWRRSEQSTDRAPAKTVVNEHESDQTSPKRAGTPEVASPPKQKPTPRSSPPKAATPSPKITRSWSSPLFNRRQAHALPRTSVSNTGQSRQLPPSYRNLSALFRRLSVIADHTKEGQLSQAYKESDFKQYWMPDETCKECYECGEKFNTFRRRHHCRLCGQIFCYRCCNVEVPGQLMGYNGGLRVCTYCHKIVLTYTQSPDMIRNLEQLQADLRAVTLESELNLSCTSGSTLSVPRPGYVQFEEDDTFYQPVPRKSSSTSLSASYFDKMNDTQRPSSAMLTTSGRPFDAFGVCSAEADMLKQDSLRELWHQIISPKTGIELMNHRFRLKTYQNCLIASDLVDWLVNYDKVSSRTQAVTIGQELLDSGWLEPVPQTKDAQIFKDEYALYQPGPVATKDIPSITSTKYNIDEESNGAESGNENNEDEDDEALPQWFRQLSGYESCEELEEEAADVVEPVTISPQAIKHSSSKLLDLDVTTSSIVNCEEESELSLRVNLHHFSEGSTADGKDVPLDPAHTVSIITEAPPPPLEQYVYTEGYPISSLRPGNKKPSDVPHVGTSSDEVLHGAKMAQKIGVSRPGSPQPSSPREDNGERQALDRLNLAHALHISNLLEQLLTDAGLSMKWKDTILPLVDAISERVRPDVRADDDMNIRQYVKFKKIPGGSRDECKLISGVVFTKNVSHKKMSCVFNNPQILVLCCAIDYQRNENRLASLDPLVLQERNFLKNFVSRVAALRPNVLLVEKTVSRLAQEMLLQHGISLALNVKPAVIERVSRCTKAETLRSMEQLSRPRLGSCQLFRVQNFKLKNGETKTLMYLEGCPTELGCTVTLRGGNSFVLTKIKKIMQFLIYVAYNQKLEIAFLMDEFSLPMDPQPSIVSIKSIDGVTSSPECSSDDRMKEESEGSPSRTSNLDKVKEMLQECKEKSSADNSRPDTRPDILDNESSNSKGSEENDNDFARTFQSALDRLILSCSFFVRYPLPHLLTREGSNCAVRSTLPKEIYWSAKLLPDNYSKQLAEDDLEELDLPNPGQNKAFKVFDVLPPHVFTSPKLVIDAIDRSLLGTVADFRAQGGRIKLKKWDDGERRRSRWNEFPFNMSSAGRNEFLSGPDDLSNREVQLGNPSKRQQSSSSPHQLNRKIDCLDPHLHQRIAVLFSSYSSESNNSPRPCISPWAVFMEFYGRNDITLGGFLERYCFRPSYVCPNPNCDVTMVDHVRYFAHGTGSVYIHMKNLESPIPGFQHTILTWSWCKECKQVTPIMPLSDRAWTLSFAKYLELRFYADSYRRRASIKPCDHSLHKDHFQYFAFANMVASFKYRPIKLFETAMPSTVISIKDECREAAYWLNDLQAMSTRGENVYHSVLDRLESLKAERVVEIHANERDTKLQQFATQLQEEHERFLEQVRVVKKKVTNLQDLQVHEDGTPDPRERKALEYVISDSLNGLKRILCELADNWTSRLQEFIQAEKKRVKPSTNLVQQREAKDKQSPVNYSMTNKSSPAQWIPSDDGGTPVVRSATHTPVESREASVFIVRSPYETLARTISQDVTQSISCDNIREVTQSPNSSITHSQSVSNFPVMPSPSAQNTYKAVTVTDGVGTLNKDFFFRPITETQTDHRLNWQLGDDEVKPKDRLAGNEEVDIDRKSQSSTSNQPFSESADIEDVTTEMLLENETSVSQQTKACANAESPSRPDNVCEKSPSPSQTGETFENASLPHKPGKVCKDTALTSDSSKSDNNTSLASKPSFVRGHRRVMSSPPIVSVSPPSPYSDVILGAGSRTGCSLDRSRSDTDVHLSTSVDNDKMLSVLLGDSTQGPDVSNTEDGTDSDNALSQDPFAVPHNGKKNDAKGHRRTLSWAEKKWQAAAKNALTADGSETDATDGTPMLKRKDKVKNMIVNWLPGAAYQPVPSTFPSHEHHLLPPGEKVLVVVSEKEPSSIIAYALSTKEYHVKLCAITQTMSLVMKSRDPQPQQLYYQQQQVESPDRDVETSLHLTLSRETMRQSSNDGSEEDFVSVNIQNRSMLDDQFDQVSIDTEHVEIVDTTSGREPVVPDRRRKQTSSHSDDIVKYSRGQSSDKSKDTGEGVVGTSREPTRPGSKYEESVSVDGKKKEDSEDSGLVEFGFPRQTGQEPLNFHIKMQFSYPGCRFVCSVYFAEQFRNLRKKIFLDGEERFIRSLAHCVVWRARGGKSGSSFSKSLDDRFVLKQMSKLELQSFLEFAPYYFQYMNKSLNDKRPPLLAKILGVYRIGYKNSLTNATMRQDVVVMENLFYDRKIDETFDLKGSMRGRYVESSGVDNDVLLDENLLEMIREHPIFIRPHSKAVLSKAIFKDTEFLAQHMVMDYSLLVGIDQTRSELVIGIIDFIRTFTWDKKLEMYVKSSGILGGQGKMPTVLSPELYRTRFTEAMQRYFLMVPDKWTGLGNDLD
ncbi:1-phosphatidylinositol 3-phosphate 5-kinase isoform X3 [Nematostella vectensis]|uniref:1-phosphatidylinositol 3-phosphate 5-kinase isoform X3 n=1 Tax=Nematostella vectensis TaxID=45351 RepID=UPI0020770514|nr:1-phosphatidylinositol 3-phosphate 5-kinase isoform X3 [Nematostella vectensis]